jgi:hypothetical protein
MILTRENIKLIEIRKGWLSPLQLKVLNVNPAIPGWFNALLSVDTPEKAYLAAWNLKVAYEDKVARNAGQRKQMKKNARYHKRKVKEHFTPCKGRKLSD